MKWAFSYLCLTLLAINGSSVAASRPNHRTRDLIRPGRELMRPDRIVGGDPVSRGQLPWQVSIQLKYPKSRGHHFCGGTLIENAWVITAAHCTKDIDYNDVVVVTGAHDLNEDNTEYKVAKVFRAEYNPDTLEHDIALLKLDVKNPLSVVERKGQEAVPLSVETRTEEGIGKQCTISGWGKLKNGLLPNILMAADVEVKSDAECGNAFKFTYYSIYPSNLCAGGGKKDACQGDSGGPLVCCEGSLEDIPSCRLAGVVSWGIGCATKGMPGVYTEVAHYTDWIKKIVEDEDGEEGARRIQFFGSEDNSIANEK